MKAIIFTSFALVISACTTTFNVTPQVQRSEQNQKQQQEQNQNQSMQSSNDASAQSSHASDSRFGLSSQPVLIICNSANSPNAVCSPFETAKDVFQKPQPQGVKK